MFRQQQFIVCMYPSFNCLHTVVDLRAHKHNEQIHRITYEQMCDSCRGRICFVVINASDCLLCILRSEPVPLAKKDGHILLFYEASCADFCKDCFFFQHASEELMKCESAIQSAHLHALLFILIIPSVELIM